MLPLVTNLLTKTVRPSLTPEPENRILSPSLNPTSDKSSEDIVTVLARLFTSGNAKLPTLKIPKAAASSSRERLDAFASIPSLIVPTLSSLFAWYV